MEKILDILSHHQFFAGLDQHFLEFLAGCGKNAVYQAGDYLFREGGEANQFFLIRHGAVALEINSHQHGTFTIQTIHEGEVVGWSWLFSPYLWHFDARAIDQVRVISLDGKCVRRKCEENHELGYEMMKRLAQVMGQRLQATRLQLLDVYCPEPTSHITPAFKGGVKTGRSTWKK